MHRYLGCDPGVHNGIAMWNKANKEFDFIKTMTVTEVLQLLAQYEPDERQTITFVIEDPDQNDPLFTRRLVAIAGAGYATLGLGTANGKACLKAAQDVGRNKQTGIIIADWAVALGYTVRRVKPNTQKWDLKVFRTYTKWAKVTSQHGRDAAKLVFGF